jgi:transcriptional regulator with XRE-family HTH domain
MQQDRQAVAQTVDRACTAGAGTVQALAEEVGVSYAALCSWSRGRRQPPAHRLRKLAEVLDSRAGLLHQLADELRMRADEKSSGAPAAVVPAPAAASEGTAAPAPLAAERREPGQTVPFAVPAARSAEVPLRVEPVSRPTAEQRDAAEQADRLARQWANTTREQARRQREALRT